MLDMIPRPKWYIHVTFADSQQTTSIMVIGNRPITTSLCTTWWRRPLVDLTENNLKPFSNTYKYDLTSLDSHFMIHHQTMDPSNHLNYFIYIYKCHESSLHLRCLCWWINEVWNKVKYFIVCMENLLLVTLVIDICIFYMCLYPIYLMFCSYFSFIWA